MELPSIIWRRSILNLGRQQEVLFELARAVDALGVAHPIHVHCTNLGMPGNIEVTLETIRAVEGHRIHLTHA